MSCPNCGSQGEVPLDRLNSRLKCRKCGTMFYMDETGSIMLGDPNDAKGRKRGRRADAGPAVDLDIGQMIRNIPKPVRVGAPALLVLVALGYGVSALMASMGLPADVEGRSKYVGELFVDNKVNQLRALATPDTADDLAKWHELMRPRLKYDGPRRSRGDVLSSAAVMRSADTSAQSFVSLVVAGAPPIPPGTLTVEVNEDEPQFNLTMALVWSKADGSWRIDGTKTLGEATRPKPQLRGPASGTSNRRR